MPWEDDEPGRADHLLPARAGIAEEARSPESRDMNKKWMKWNHYKNSDLFKMEPIRTIDVTCFHCNRETKIVAENAEDEETKAWRLRYEKLMGQLNQAVADCDMLHGDNPIRIMFTKRLLKIRDEMGLPKMEDEEGEEWKK